MKKQSGNHGLKHSANALKHYGQRGDSVLAHISPEEAKYLEHHFGGDINPYTGLPQYGLFRSLFRGIGRAFRKPFKILAPMAGTLVGGLLGGPAGAIAGGSLGGGLSSKNHKLQSALFGGLMGLGHGLFSPGIGQALGWAPESMLGKAALMGGPSLANQLGLGSMMGGKSPAYIEGDEYGTMGPSGQMMGPVMGNKKNSKNAGLLGLLSGLGGQGKLLDTALLATSLAGTLGAKSKTPALGSPENETLQQALDKNKIKWGPEHQYKPITLKTEQAQFPPEGYKGTNWKFFPTPEEQKKQLSRVQKEMSAPGYHKYAKGGKVKGYYEGGDGGQDDTIPVNLPEKSYIMDATTVSLVGDGNSKHGAKKIKSLLDEFEKSGIQKKSQSRKSVKAMVSDGELYVSPEEVAAAGGGNIEKGVKNLDKFRKNIRKHKGVKKFLPPKSKPLNQYLR